MAKVEQFPDQTGENNRTEDITKQKTRDMSEDVKRIREAVRSDEAQKRQEADAGLPDDSLLMGS